MDRIAILQLKSERLDSCVRGVVLAELARARAESERALPDSERLRELGRELSCVNERLWDAEEELRRCERLGAFGARFVELARMVYLTNDRRAALKRAIDDLVGSSVREHKSHSLPEL